MTLVRPFTARIVKQDRATDVVCPMHDALSTKRRAKLLAENPLSYLNVTRSSHDMPNATDAEIGEANAKSLEHLLQSGVYGELGEPALYVYRIRQNGIDHTGIVADLDVSGFVDGRVLGHESVNPERVAALVRHFESVPTRSELIAIMHHDDEKVSAAVTAATEREPILTFTDLTGIEQMVWQLADVDVPMVVERLGAQRQYIADGHHRVAATVARWQEHGSPRGGNVLCVLYAEAQTDLLAFHRLVAGPIDAEELLDGLRAVADVEQVSGPEREAGHFGLHLAGHWYRISPRDGRALDGVEGLDVTALDRDILSPLLDTRSGDKRVSYVSELADISETVAAHPDDALFLLAAPTHEQLVTVAERGEVMPPKSTYVEPKPRAGVFLHPRQGPVDPKDLPDAN